ncbi:MAG: hypothetical protein R3225_06585 [Halofilum sp. (in: g-proteobacteria)]|nr:hypothetical protein [Halofilum sp. (in: g-proteobacteria)]
MRRVLRGFAVGLLIGGLIGLWVGINIGKNQPLFTNPFAESPALQKAREYLDRAEQTMKEAGESAEESIEQQ